MSRNIVNITLKVPDQKDRTFDVNLEAAKLETYEDVLQYIKNEHKVDFIGDFVFVQDDKVIGRAEPATGGRVELRNQKVGITIFHKGQEVKLQVTVGTKMEDIREAFAQRMHATLLGGVTKNGVNVGETDKISFSGKSEMLKDGDRLVGTFSVFVRDPHINISHDVEVTAKSNVKELRERYCSKASRYERGSTLTFDGMRLDDEQTLFDCKIEHESFVDFTPAEMYVYVVEEKDMKLAHTSGSAVGTRVAVRDHLTVRELRSYQAIRRTTSRRPRQTV